MNIFTLPIIGKKIFRRRVNSEGGEQTSDTIRKIAKKHKIDVGMYTYGSCFQLGFNVGGSVIIGRYCSFGPNVHYFGANHPMEQSVMSPYFYNDDFGYEVEDIPRECLNVGNDVWVGYGTVITSKCHTIGNGAVIGSGTIVTRDIPPYAVVAGNPGRIIRFRFDENTISKLEESKWWELDPDDLMQYYEFRKNPIEFSEIIIQKRVKSLE